MAARAIWKAVLRLKDVDVPVRLYSAVRDHDIHFHLLHAKDRARVRERFVNAETKREVDPQHIRAGYAVESGEWVVLDAKEKASLAPKPSRDIDLVSCVPLDALPLSAYARPYWLGPDGKAEAYSAAAHALAESQQQALVAWVMRGKHHFGALQSREGHLALIDLRSSDEWVDPKLLELPEGRAFDKRELAMAEQLINALHGEFDHASFHDEYRERVQAMLDAKARGVHPKRSKAKKPAAASTSLATALSASLRGLNKERKSA